MRKRPNTSTPLYPHLWMPNNVEEGISQFWLHLSRHLSCRTYVGLTKRILFLRPSLTPNARCVLNINYMFCNQIDDWRRFFIANNLAKGIMTQPELEPDVHLLVNSQAKIMLEKITNIEYCQCRNIIELTNDTNMYTSSSSYYLKVYNYKLTHYLTLTLKYVFTPGHGFCLSLKFDSSIQILLIM